MGAGKHRHVNRLGLTLPTGTTPRGAVSTNGKDILGGWRRRRAYGYVQRETLATPTTSLQIATHAGEHPPVKHHEWANCTRDRLRVVTSASTPSVPAYRLPRDKP